jgi:antibiotic biosynthesis monooxygenase (ABM) superfamily enzyme
MASLRRSWSLTRGSFWRLSAVYTVALIILIVFYVVLGSATAFVVAVAAHGELAVMTAAYAVVAVALGAFVFPFYSAVQLAVLGDLTARREGIDLAQRISATA